MESNGNNYSLPSGFDWRIYLELNHDLHSAGIGSEQEAVLHYLKHGRQEKRLYRWVPIRPDPDMRGSTVFICGTSPEVEVLNDRHITESISKRYKVLCINSAFHYFDTIYALFLNGRFRHVTDSTFTARRIGQIFTPFDCDIRDHPLRHYLVDVDPERFHPEIHFDLNKVLPHGPTTLLDVVFPFCVFNKVSKIFILGAEYMRMPDGVRRHSMDGLYVDRSKPSMDTGLEMEFAHWKLQIWKACFESFGIECFALCDRSETPFEKMDLRDIL
jgi:hypothetical protein